MGIDIGNGGSDGLQKEMPVTVADVKPVPPHTVFTDERLGKPNAELVG